MAEEKPRAPRARKKTTKAEAEVATDKTTAKRPSGAKAAAAASKPAAQKKKPPATPRAKKAPVVAVEPGDVATLAYLLWERGEPGDAAEHWQRAEQELKAA